MTVAVSPTAFSDTRRLSGADKVATLLLAMGKPMASKLLKHFDAADLKIITRSAAALGPVPMEALGALVEELAADFARETDLHGTVSDLEQMLGSVLPADQVADIMADIRGASNASTWVQLSSLPEADLAAYLDKENPQTAALILSRLTPEAAAKTLAIFSRELRNELTRRMLALRPVSDPAIRLLETKLRDDLLLGVGKRDKEVSTQGRIADILNRMEPEQAEEVLASIEVTRPIDAAQLRSKMFSFADIAKLSTKARAVLFDKLQAEQIVFALKGTDDAFRELVLAALGARARRLVENELKSDPGSQKEISNARKVIAATVLDLMSRGEIEAPGSEAEG